jgi:hypothetical protein
MKKISQYLQATVFETQTALDRYLKKHPKSDKTKHSVKPPDHPDNFHKNVKALHGVIKDNHQKLLKLDPDNKKHMPKIKHHLEQISNATIANSNLHDFHKKKEPVKNLHTMAAAGIAHIEPTKDSIKRLHDILEKEY